MRTLRLLAPILLLVAVTPAHAQRAGVTGTVVDSITGQPLEGVQVVMIDMSISTVTDSKGSFQFYGVQSGQHTLTVRRLCYEPAAIRFQTTAQLLRPRRSRLPVPISDSFNTDAPTPQSPLQARLSIGLIGYSSAGFTPIFIHG